jgi:hypothetical protein
MMEINENWQTGRVYLYFECAAISINLRIGGNVVKNEVVFKIPNPGIKIPSIAGSLSRKLMQYPID